MLARWTVCVVVVSCMASRHAAADTDRLEGRITISRGNNGGERGSGVEAVFAHSPAWGTVLATDGPCTLRARPAKEGVSAGTIAISGTTSPITLEPSGIPGGVTYRSAGSVPVGAFYDGSAITVHVDGSADVDAFTASITAPPALKSYDRPRDLSRNGYTAYWEPNPGTEIVIMIGAFVSGGTALGELLVCRVPDTGTFAVPASALALLPDAARVAMVNVARVSEAVQMIGHTAVTVDVMSSVTSRPIPLTEAVPTGYPRRFLSLGLGQGGFSRSGDVHDTGYRFQFGQRLGDGFHLVEEVDWFEPDRSRTGIRESHLAFGLGVRWTPFAPLRVSGWPRGSRSLLPLLPVSGSVSGWPALYLTAQVGANVRTRVTQTSSDSMSTDAWSPMASLAIGQHVVQGRDWALGLEFREQLTRYDDHLQRGWLLMLAVHVNDW